MDTVKKPKTSLWGCVLALLLIVGVLYGGPAAAAFFLWGPGLRGTYATHRDPSLIGTFQTITIYSSTIASSTERISIGRTWWWSVRSGICAGLLIASIAWIIRRRTMKRGTALMILAVNAVVFSLAFHAMSTRIRFTPRQRQVEIGTALSTRTVRYDGLLLVTSSGDIGGGRSGTRNTTAVWKANDILLIDADRKIVAELLSLPFESREYADRWRDEMARRTSVPSMEVR